MKVGRAVDPDQDNALVPLHLRMGPFDWDLIRGGHYGQRSCEPRKQAEHMAAPTKAANVQIFLANSEPSTHGTKRISRSHCGVNATIYGMIFVMDGVHDMGGMDGFGKVEVEKNEPVFQGESADRKWRLELGECPLLTQSGHRGQLK